ncbi:serine/threonine protein kinase [Nostoc carneum NIES-2107]|nr:serine/threonine protein kinase [Nostoc carneum NIES-2107]
MRVYCTNPNCPQPEKDFTENLDNINPKKQRYCEWCRTERILGNGRYLALEEIGSGGFGKTFRAHNFNLDQDCAIKILRPIHRLDPLLIESVQRGFKQGAKILNNLSHPQIPKIYDYFDLEVSEHQKFFYLVQTYIPGQTLDRELANKTHKRFSETEVVEVLQSLLDIVDYTHQQNVIHRDIKPANIIRHRDNKKLYLIDFDSAIKRELEPEIPVNQSMAMGTPGYAPPEQLSGRGIDRSADLYAIAATCVYLLTGKEPMQICNNHNPLYESWRRYVPTVEKKLADILDKMLSPDPKLRYKSAKEVVEALSAISTPDTVISPPNPTPTQPQRTPTTQRTQTTSIFQRLIIIRRFWYLLSLALSAILIALLIHYCDNRNIPTPVVSCISDNNFSCGEKRLIPPEGFRQEGFRQEIEAKARQVGKKAFQEFDAGTAAFKKGLQGDKNAFSEAKKHFDEQLKIYPNDPETRIALNNAKAADNGKFVKVAVCVPNPGIAEEFLRGVAIVQDKINNNNFMLIKGKMLFIQICTDGDREDQAERVAELIKKDNTIFGVIGHYTSNTTKKAGDIYDQNIVAISPTSTAVRDNNYQLSNYVFRVSPDASLSAKKLVKYIGYQQQKIPTQLSQAKVAILYKYSNDPNNQDDYNKSFIKEFKREIQPNKIVIIDECNIAEPGENISNCMQQAKDKQANFMLIAISNKVLEQERNKNALEIVANRGNMILLAGNATYSTTANISGFTEQLLISVQWIRSEPPSELSELEKQANDIFAEPNKRVLINFRTAMTYDAIQAMVAGIRTISGDITREKLYQELQKSTFSAPGANLEVRFNNGDRQFDASNENKLMFLVTPVKNSRDRVPQFKEVKIN